VIDKPLKFSLSFALIAFIVGFIIEGQGNPLVWAQMELDKALIWVVGGLVVGRVVGSVILKKEEIKHC
jgi:hypothetical protein